MKKALLIIIFIITTNICYANQLINAVEKNSISQLRLFLDSGINPNIQDSNRSTALIKASFAW